MSTASLFEGILGGFNQRTTESRAEAAKAREAQMARDQRIFEHLAKADDPEISMAALTGLTSMATGDYEPKKGLDKFLGTNSGKVVSPHITRIVQMLRTGGFEGMPQEAPAPMVEADELGTEVRGAPPQPSAPPQSTPGAMAMPPSPSSAGGGVRLPAMPVTMGPLPGGATGPSAAPLGQTTPPPSTVPASPVTAQAAAKEPDEMGVEVRGALAPPPNPNAPVRRVFNTPAQNVRNETIAREQAQVEGEVEGMVAAGIPRAEALELIKEERRRRATGGTSGFQSIAGQMPDGTPAFGVFNRVSGTYTDPLTGRPLQGFQPRTTTGSTSMGTDREALARATYGKPYAQLTQPQQQDIIQRELAFTRNESYERGIGSGQAGAVQPLTPLQVSSTERDLRADFERYVVGARQTLQQGKVIETAFTQIGQNLIDGAPLGAQSQAMISAFARMIDELSAVRTEEYARTAQDQALMSQLEGWWTKVTQGGAGIARAEIENIVNVARALVQGREQYIRDQAQTTMRAARSTPGIRVENVLTPDVLRILGPGAGVGASPATVAPPPNPNAPPRPGAAATPPRNSADPAQTGLRTSNGMPFVGNVLPEGTRQGTDQATGGRVAQLPSGEVVGIYQGPDGRWYY